MRTSWGVAVVLTSSKYLPQVPPMSLLRKEEHCSFLGGNSHQETRFVFFSQLGGIALHQARSEAESPMLQASQEAAAHRFSSLVLTLGHLWIWREGKVVHSSILLVALDSRQERGNERVCTFPLCTCLGG